VVEIIANDQGNWMTPSWVSFTGYKRPHATTYSSPNQYLLKTPMIFLVLVKALRMLSTSTQKTQYLMLSVLSVVK
jgi:hypothetical protein